jgi:hypothetical protein
LAESVDTQLSRAEADLIAACKCNLLRKPFDLRDMSNAVAALAPRLHDAAR